MEETDRLYMLGFSSNGLRLDYLGPNQSWWNPPLFNMIKLNIDAAWERDKVSVTVLVHNYEGDVVELWYNNYECAFPLAIELLIIQKAYLGLNNFLGQQV